MCAIAAIRGDCWRAGALAAAADAIRQRIGVFDVAAFMVHPVPLAALRERDPEGLAAGERAGAELDLAEAIAIALPERRAGPRAAREVVKMGRRVARHLRQEDAVAGRRE